MGKQVNLPAIVPVLSDWRIGQAAAHHVPERIAKAEPAIVSRFCFPFVWFLFLLLRSLCPFVASRGVLA